jgi:hypothetical protein
MDDESLIDRRVFGAAELVHRFPPRLLHPNKQLVFGLTCPPRAMHHGMITISRWMEIALPEVFEPRLSAAVEAHDGMFVYPSSLDPCVMIWHLNFAHADLFRAYGGPLFAQDEMQVAEHPALASLREATLAHDMGIVTVEAGRATPILIGGVERRCAIATEPNPSQGRPQGLYGNQFARATPEAIRAATTLLDPPTISNILAMEAPPPEQGLYTADQIDYILSTAYTGFCAARRESALELEERGLKDMRAVVEIHTGFWGCGAYGGNKTLMALLQLIAAHLSGIDRLGFYTFDHNGRHAFDRAQQLLEQELFVGAEVLDYDMLLNQLVTQNFAWGVSDGN